MKIKCREEKGNWVLVLNTLAIITMVVMMLLTPKVVGPYQGNYYGTKDSDVERFIDAKDLLLKQPDYTIGTIKVYGSDKTNKISKLDERILDAKGYKVKNGDFVTLYGGAYRKGKRYTDVQDTIRYETVISYLDKNKDKFGDLFDNMHLFLSPYESPDIQGFHQVWKQHEVDNFIMLFGDVNYVSENGWSDRQKIEFHVPRTLTHEMGHAFERNIELRQGNEKHIQFWEEYFKIYPEFLKGKTPRKAAEEVIEDRIKDLWEDRATENFAEDYKIAHMGDYDRYDMEKTTSLPYRVQVQSLINKWETIAKNLNKNLPKSPETNGTVNKLRPLGKRGGMGTLGNNKTPKVNNGPVNNSTKTLRPMKIAN